jgi:high-affinity Fe2+/Pb2+ permease
MLIRFLRYGLPAVLVVAGFVILFVADDNLRWDGWAMCVGAGLAILLMNVLFRYGSKGDRERDAEVAAREYYAEHGRWPDEHS